MATLLEIGPGMMPQFYREGLENENHKFILIDWDPKHIAYLQRIYGKHPNFNIYLGHFTPIIENLHAEGVTADRLIVSNVIGYHAMHGKLVKIVDQVANAAEKILKPEGVIHIRESSTTTFINLHNLFIARGYELRPNSIAPPPTSNEFEIFLVKNQQLQGEVSQV